MTVDVVDGIKVLKLTDDPLGGGREERAKDMLTMAYLWQLLSGGHDLRDGSVFARRVL